MKQSKIIDNDFYKRVAVIDEENRREARLLEDLGIVPARCPICGGIRHSNTLINVCVYCGVSSK